VQNSNRESYPQFLPGCRYIALVVQWYNYSTSVHLITAKQDVSLDRDFKKMTTQQQTKRPDMGVSLSAKFIGGENLNESYKVIY